MVTNCALLLKVIADIYFCIVMKWISCLAFTNLNGLTSYRYLKTLLDMLICSLI